MASATITAAPEAGRTSLWQNRRFLVVLASHVISQLGDGFHSVALGLWVLQATGSASAMSAVVMVRLVIGILLGTVGGTVADRSDRWRMMWGFDIVRGALVSLIALAIARPGEPFVAVLILTGLVAAAGQFRGPAFSAAISQIVPRGGVAQARSLMQITGTTANVVGPFLGGAMVALWGGWVAMGADALSFWLSALLVLLAGSFASPGQTDRVKKAFWRDMVEGWSYIRQNPFARAATMLGPSLNFFANGCALLVPVLAVKVWLSGPVEFGVLEAALPLGMALGGLLIMGVSKRLRRRGWWMGLFLMGIGPLFVLFGLMPNTYAAAPLMVALGAVLTVIQVLFATGLQTQTEPELQGRIFGTVGSLSNVATPLSVALVGPLADLYGPVPIMLITGGLLTVLAPLAVGLLPGIRTYD